MYGNRLLQRTVRTTRTDVRAYSSAARNFFETANRAVLVNGELGGGRRGETGRRFLSARTASL